MISELCSLNNELNNLNLTIALLKESIDKCILLRDDCIQRNKRSERKLQSLASLKDHYESLKDILLQENCSFSVNAGKRSVLLSHKIKEFQKTKEQTKLRCESLPVFIQLQEISEINEKLNCEYLKCHERLGNLRKDYWKVFRAVESDFISKLMQFSEEFSQLKMNKFQETNSSTENHKNL